MAKKRFREQVSLSDDSFRAAAETLFAAAFSGSTFIPHTGSITLMSTQYCPYVSDGLVELSPNFGKKAGVMAR